MKARAAGFGRDPERVFIVPGVRPVIGDTREQADARYHDLTNLVSIENALSMLGRPFNDYDFSQHDLDAPFPDVEAFGLNSNQSATLRITRAAREGNLTLRQVALRFATPRSEFVGTPEEVADALQLWLDERAADGFIVSQSLPGQLELFVDKVVPILQARGIYKTDYEGQTLREHFGLDVPVNRYTANAQRIAAQ